MVPYEIYYKSDADCENEVIDPKCDPCLIPEKGRIRGVAFIHKKYYPILIEDPTSQQLWQNGIAQGYIKVIHETLGSTDGGSEETGPGYGDNSETLLGYNHAPVIKDPNYKGNSLFWNSIKGKSSYHLAYRTETQVHISDNTVTTIPKNSIEEALNSNVDWNVTIKWFQKNLLLPHDTPEGIFSCFQIV